MAVTREEIVAAALGLLDEDGLAGLTLRRLADRLGIRAPTLYWHFRDKRQLLDLMAEAIMTEALAGRREPAPGQPWWEWLAERARHQRAALLARRDGVLVLAGNRPGPQTMPLIERQLQALTEAGFQAADAMLTLLALNAYVLGDALDTQREADRETGGGPALDVSPYPLMLSAARTAGPPERRFEHGLQLMINGLRATYGA
jgi:TetR/AcrR family tetracycline transcriptional repressor